MNNRRADCIKNCAAPKGARIWVQLYHSPDEYDKAHGHGAFDKYYSTTSGGENITVTKHHHKGNLARTFNVEKVCEAHIDFNHANAADEVCADRGILTEQFHLLGIEKRSKFQIVVYGTLQRDVDRAGAFIQGKYDKEVPLSKRCRPGLNAVPSCRPDVHEDSSVVSYRSDRDKTVFIKVHGTEFLGHGFSLTVDCDSCSSLSTCTPRKR